MDKQWYWTSLTNINRSAPEFCKSRGVLRSRGDVGKRFLRITGHAEGTDILPAPLSDPRRPESSIRTRISREMWVKMLGPTQRGRHGESGFTEKTGRPLRGQGD